MRIPKQILERRRSIRIEESLSFNIGLEEFEIEARTINLSSTGVMCLVNKDIPLMTKLRIAFSIPAFGKKNAKLKMIYFTGVVVRKELDPLDKNMQRLGIFFSDVKSKDQKILDDYIQHRLNP